MPPRSSLHGLALAAAALLAPDMALAHTGLGDAGGFAHGFAHPVGGLDHILAMVAVGMFAANLGGRALWAVPDGRSDTVTASTTLPQFPPYEHSTDEVVDLITDRIYAAVDTLRNVHDAVDAEDPSTADILHQLIDGLEKLAWLIKSENRKV